MAIHIYGIKCPTVRNAMKWLDARAIEYIFHDYKKEAPEAEVLTLAIEHHGWDKVINKRGTTWRGLDSMIKDSADEDNAIALGVDHPSLLKRPLLVRDGKTYLGFKVEQYEEIFG